MACLKSHSGKLALRDGICCTPPAIPSLYCKVATAPQQVKCGFVIPFDGTRTYPAGIGAAGYLVYHSREITFSQTTNNPSYSGAGCLDPFNDCTLAGSFNYTVRVIMDTEGNLDCVSASGSANSSITPNNSGDPTNCSETYAGDCSGWGPNGTCTLPSGAAATLADCNDLIYFFTNLSTWITKKPPDVAEGTCTDSDSTRNVKIQLYEPTAPYSNAELIEFTKDNFEEYSGPGYSCDCLDCAPASTPDADYCGECGVAFTVLGFGEGEAATVCTAQKIKYKLAYNSWPPVPKKDWVLKWDEDFEPQYKLEAYKSSGSLEIGATYSLNYIDGDDFSNVGAVNVSSTSFVATAADPAIWTNGSAVARHDYVWPSVEGVTPARSKVEREFTFTGITPADDPELNAPPPTPGYQETIEYEIDAPDEPGTIMIRNVRWDLSKVLPP